MKYSDPHPTQSVLIDGKGADIDLEMVELVKFINSIPEIYTLYCCQGDEPVDKYEEGWRYPYISFYTSNKHVIDKVHKACKEPADEAKFWIRLGADYNYPPKGEDSPTYHICFENKIIRDHFFTKLMEVFE